MTLKVTGETKYGHLFFSRPAVKQLPKLGVRLAVRHVSNLQPRPVRIGTLNQIPRVKRVQRSLLVNFFSS